MVEEIKDKTRSDEELVLRIQTGSQSSFEELMVRYRKRLTLFLKSKTKNAQDVEDLVQETFLKAYANIESFNPNWKFTTWIYTIAYRLAVSLYRKNKNEKNSEYWEVRSHDPAEKLLTEDNMTNMWASARELPGKQYKALWLRYGEGLSVKEVARVMKVSSINARVLLHRARLSLVKMMESRVASSAKTGLGVPVKNNG